MDRYIVGKGEDIWLADNYAKIMRTITTQDLQKLLNNQSDRIDELQNQLKSQPEEIVEKIRRELGLNLKYKLNDEVYVLKICNQLDEVLDTILKEYQK